MASATSGLYRLLHNFTLELHGVEALFGDQYRMVLETFFGYFAYPCCDCRYDFENICLLRLLSDICAVFLRVGLQGSTRVLHIIVVLNLIITNSNCLGMKAFPRVFMEIIVMTR